MTFKDAITKSVISKRYSDIVTDFTCRGVCSKCGNCCGIVLPMDQEDADRIQEYVIKNKIFPQKHTMIMTQKLQCPYYTGNREKGCAIYEARPKICRFFKCDLKGMPMEQLKEMKNAVPVDMWSFARAIESEMKRNGIN